MALPTYDSTKHHIGLKVKGGATLFGLMLEGGYRRQAQREGGGAPDFGGASDLLGQAPSVSRWTQDAYEGGMFAYNWGRDDAMFADCTGFIPMPQSRSLQSCPPMFKKKAVDSDTELGFTSDVPKNMFMVGGSIYVVWSHTLARYQIDTDTLSFGEGNINAAVSTIIDAQYDSNDQMIWAYVRDTPAAIPPSLYRIKTDLTAPVISNYAGPVGTATHVPYGFTMYNGSPLIHQGRKVYSGAVPADPEVGSVITWTEIGRLQGRWKDSIPYNGMIYILCNDGSFRSHIVAFDGTDLLPICTLPFNFYGKSLCEYGGRVFVGGTGTDVNGGEHYAELYEITGSSVRLVRSFSPETRNFFLGGLAGEWPRSIDDMTVFEGMLWFAQKGKRMIAYDLSSDGFFGAAEIQSNTDLNCAKLVSGRGRIWGYFVDDSLDTDHGIYRIAQPADTISTWYPTLITSDFFYEPAMKKRWGKMRVMSRYGGVASGDYSVDGGATWTALTFAVSNTYGQIYYSDADLAAISPSEHIRFRVKLTSTGDAGDARTYHRELVATTVSFAMLDTGKTGWSFTINGSIEIETRDAELSEATTQAYDVSDVRSTLWGYWTNKSPLTFRDVDQTDYDVQLVDITEVQPVIGPNPSGETGPEALYAVTLLEV